MRKKKDLGFLDIENKKRDSERFNFALLYEILFWIFGVAAAVFLGIMTANFIGTSTSVVGTSMEPALFNGEEVLLNKIVYQFSVPKRGDVIAFHPNGNENTHLYIKRIVGLPGESIQIKQGSVYINGEMYAMDTETNDPGVAAELIELSDDEYFVMGDNRDNSEDSRSANIGNVSREMITGKVWYHLKYDNIRMGRVE